MAYSDYGAFVYRNGERRRDKEDAPLFATDEETFGADINTIPSGARIWVSLIHAKETGQELNYLNSIYHGVLGDGPVRVACYKYGLPQIYDMGCKDGPKEIDYYDAEKTDSDDLACPKKSEQKVRHDGSKCGILRLQNSPVCHRKGARHVLW